MGQQRDTALRASAEAAPNVVPLLRPHAPASGGTAPTIKLETRDLPARGASPRRSARLAALLLLSLAGHGAVLAYLSRQPEPASSIGIPAVAVEIVFGGDAPAGVGEVPSASEEQPVEPPQEQDGPVKVPELAEQPVLAPAEPPQRAEAEEAIEQIERLRQEAVEKASEESETAEALVQEAIAEPVPPPPPKPKPEPKETKRAAEKTQKRTALPAPPTASGIGRGASPADANYHGLIAAHLARHKQYPAEARASRSEGTASIAFAIDGGGRVMSVRLVRSSGVAALDQESLAMVRRASPFPAPPGRKPMRFTVPVTFQVR